MTTLNMEDINMMVDEWQLEQLLGPTLFDDPWKTVDFVSKNVKPRVQDTNNDLDKLFELSKAGLAEPFCEDWMEDQMSEMLHSLVEESGNGADQIANLQVEKFMFKATCDVKGPEILRSLMEQDLEEVSASESHEAQVMPTIDLCPESSFSDSFESSASTIELTDMDEIMHSPLSTADVDSLLSGSEPASPRSQSSIGTSKCSELEAMLLDNSVKLNGKIRTVSTPYSRSKRGSKSKVEDVSCLEVPIEYLSKKDKKKLQNKNAAIRYRQKKKLEAEVVKDDENGLESKNQALHEKVDQLSREIKYMKDLMAEVCKAKKHGNS